MNRYAEYRPLVSSLHVRDLSVQVSLGCTAEERATLQEIRISVDFRFEGAPTGALTDSLDDTVCYAKVSEILKSHCESKEFNLIERIGAECFSLVRNLTQNLKTQVRISIHKVSPPVEDLINGTHFICGDFL